MAGPKYLGFDTLSVHAGQQPDATTGAPAAPVYQSAACMFNDADHAASLFDVAGSGYSCAQIANATVGMLEQRLAALEGGIGAVATASKMAAIHLAIATLMDAGSHIVASHSLDGDTDHLLRYTLPRFGIRTTFVDLRRHNDIEAAITPQTRLLVGQTLANPLMAVMDIPRIAAIAHAHHLPLMVDATVTTPYLSQPIEQGADLVIHSLTQFIAGQGSTAGGAVIDSGRFNWAEAGLYPNLTEPDPRFDGVNFAEEFGISAFLLRARHQGLRAFGAALSPTSAVQFLQGIETLPLRMQRHSENTRAVVSFLERNDAIEKIHFPELAYHPDYQLAQQLLPKGCGGVFSIELKGGDQAAIKCIEHLRLFSYAADIGGAKSRVNHPGSTTHYKNAEEITHTGIPAGLVRLSIGLEDPEDLLEDLGRALHLCQK